MSKIAKSIFFTLVLYSLFLIPYSSVNAQTSTTSGTLPQSGVETPLLLLSGGGMALFSSGFLLRKLQK